MTDSGRIHPAVAFLDRMLRPPEEKIRLQTGIEASRAPDESLSPGVVWEGILLGWSGYAKANREILFRAANTLYVEAKDAIPLSWNHPPVERRLAAHYATRVASSCPILRFSGPDEGGRSPHRRRINWTMMETERIHKDMIRRLNSGFDELWTPTSWNAEAFRGSGLEIPARVMPLGIDTLLYRPRPRTRLPQATLMTTRNAGRAEVPEGFLFVYVCLPSIRKGHDVLFKAFEAAFADDPDVALVLGVTYGSRNYMGLSPRPKAKARVYALEGTFTEHEMARIYNGCDAYVCSSRGEGWNLPACEAASSGLPVIVPRNTVHPEVFGKDAWYVDCQGDEAIPSLAKVSQWYEGARFSRFTKKSVDQLAGHLREIRRGGRRVSSRAATLREQVRTFLTWDRAASLATGRLLEIQ